LSIFSLRAHGAAFQIAGHELRAARVLAARLTVEPHGLRKPPIVLVCEPPAGYFQNITFALSSFDPITRPLDPKAGWQSSNHGDASNQLPCRALR